MALLYYIISFFLLIEVTFESPDFKGVVENYIIVKGKYKKENIVIDYLNLPEKVTVKAANAQLRVADVSRDYLSGNVTIPVNIIAGDKILKRIYVAVKIHVFDSVYISTKKVNQYENFSAENVERKWLEITNDETAIRSEKEIIGKRANRYISEGKIITLNIIENMPIIKSGQQITIISRVNSVVISATGIAKEDGRKGEIISIENSASGAKLKGRVIDKDKVEIIR